MGAIALDEAIGGGGGVSGYGIRTSAFVRVVHSVLGPLGTCGMPVRPAYWLGDMGDATFILFLAMVVWLAIESSGGGGGKRDRVRMPALG